MIRNVVMGRIRPDATDDVLRDLDAALDGIARLDLPGMRANHVGHDLGLRAGGWDLAITNDWDDSDAYRAYDADEEHNRYRAQVVAACAEVARVQIELADPPG